MIILASYWPFRLRRIGKQRTYFVAFGIGPGRLHRLRINIDPGNPPAPKRAAAMARIPEPQP
jgi:hypothetical protein